MTRMSNDVSTEADFQISVGSFSGFPDEAQAWLDQPKEAVLPVACLSGVSHFRRNLSVVLVRYVPKTWTRQCGEGDLTQ